MLSPPHSGSSSAVDAFNGSEDALKLQLEGSIAKVRALMSPRNVVLVGASDRPGTWGARIWRNLERYGFSGNLYPVNPKRSEIYGTKCYPDLASLPEAPDLLLVLVPAEAVPDVLIQGAAAGARSAIVYTAGFGEAHTAAGDMLEQRLKEVVRQTGIALIGPNCLGSVFGPAGLVTMTDDRKLSLASGPVGMVGQSGGIMLFTNRVLSEKGVASGYIVTSGNEVGLTTADYIAYFASDPNIKVIFSYLEAVRDPDRFLAACRMAQAAGKPIVMLKLGASEAGRAAAMAHTGALAGSMEAFDAVAGAAGVIRAETLDDAVEMIDYLVHAPIPKGRRIGALTLSGAYRGLILDAAERNGLQLADLAPQTKATLNDLLGVGSIVGNPLDGGFGVLTSVDTFMATVKTMLSDPNIDILLIQEEAPRDPELKRSMNYLRALHDYILHEATKPIACMSMLSHSENDFSRSLREELPKLTFLHEANKGLRAIASLVRYQENGELGKAELPVTPRLEHPAISHCRAVAQGADGLITLNELESKALVEAFGIGAPREVLATSQIDAVAAADRIGYPVVLKGVSAKITHKSDAGIVILDVKTPEAVGQAYGRIAANVAGYPGGAELEGVLVCEQVVGTLEVSLGLHRDPQMGFVVMVGSGGVLIELFKDVAFSALPITPQTAEAMIARTRMSERLKGFRGAPAYDRKAVVDALCAVGRMASELGDVLVSIDINPFAVRPANGGGVALDALVVLQGGQTK